MIFGLYRRLSTFCKDIIVSESNALKQIIHFVGPDSNCIAPVHFGMLQGLRGSSTIETKSRQHDNTSSSRVSRRAGSPGKRKI